MSEQKWDWIDDELNLITKGEWAEFYKQAEQKMKQKENTADEVERLREQCEWMLHNMGLINEWAMKEWKPDRHPPLIEWLRLRIDAAIAEEKK